MTWPGFPKRLLSALKSLCCLADSGGTMQSQEIAEKIGVSKAETAKILQLLAWGGFVTSRRGYQGGFHLAKGPDQITTGEVMDFFFSKHPPDTDGDCPILKVLRESTAPGQAAFARLTLTDVAAGHTMPDSKTLSGKEGVK